MMFTIKRILSIAVALTAVLALVAGAALGD